MDKNLRSTSGVAKPILGIAAILTVVGLVIWYFQITKGLGITGLNQTAVWGLYIAGFFTAASAGAGALALGGLSVFFKKAFNYKDRFYMFSIAFACFVVGGLLVAMDIGRIDHIFSMIFSFKVSSSMYQDFMALAVCVIVSVWGIFRARSEKIGPVFGIICLIAALGIIIVEGLMLSGVSAHVFWGSGTLAAFIVSMVVAGAAVSLFILKDKQHSITSKILIVGLVVSALLTIGEVLTLFASSEVSSSLELNTLISGSASIYFWFYVIAGLIIPFILLIKFNSSNRCWTASILALLGVLAEKIWIIVVGFEHPLLAIPGTTVYQASIYEFLAVIGMAGLGLLVFAFVIKVLGKDSAKNLSNIDIAQ